LCKKLDPLVSAWNNRDLRKIQYPFVLVDALVLKVRENGRVRSLQILENGFDDATAVHVLLEKYNNIVNDLPERGPALFSLFEKMPVPFRVFRPFFYYR